MPESPASENNTAMGATAPGKGIKGENVSDASQRKEYFGGGSQQSQTTQQAGDAISKGVTAAEESAGRAADKYKEDKEKRFE